MLDNSRFSERTLLAAVDLLAKLSQSEFDRTMLRLSVNEYIPHGSHPSRRNKANILAKFAKENPEHITAMETNLIDEIVQQTAIQAAGPLSWHETEVTNFRMALERNGFTLTDEGEIRKTLPDVADLPEADDELHALLDELGMIKAKGHLDQAIENHAKGNWAAANAQLRTFLEGLFDDIYRLLEPSDDGKPLSSENRRQKLASRKPPLFDGSLNEFSQDGKGFINGVFRRLHPEGPHPGLSNNEDCTFRLHLTLIVARHYLRKAKSLLSQT